MICWSAGGRKRSYEKARDEIRQVVEIAQGRYLEGKIEGKIEGKLEGKIEGKIKGKIEGKIEAKREMLFRLLGKMSIQISEVERARIETCEDGRTLDGWMDNVFAAKTAADVFAERSRS